MIVRYIDGDEETHRHLNLKASQELSKHIAAKDSLCWYNCMDVLPFVKDGEYVEGWAIYTARNQDAEVWEHSWVERKGEIIDTLPDIDWEHERTIYFPGKRFSKTFVSKHFPGVMPFVKTVFSVAPKSYQDAFKRAMSYQPKPRKQRRRK